MSLSQFMKVLALALVPLAIAFIPFDSSARKRGSKQKAMVKTQAFQVKFINDAKRTVSVTFASPANRHKSLVSWFGFITYQLVDKDHSHQQVAGAPVDIGKLCQAAEDIEGMTLSLRKKREIFYNKKKGRVELLWNVGTQDEGMPMFTKGYAKLYLNAQGKLVCESCGVGCKK